MDGGPCTVMIQIDPEDATTLDFEGVSGAIGRLECHNNGIVVDLKGCQYQGSILPCSTALTVGFVGTFQNNKMTTSNNDNNDNDTTRNQHHRRHRRRTPQLKVEGITNEYATLIKTKDSMTQFDAIVQGDMDESFQVRDDNVNNNKISSSSKNNNNATTTNKMGNNSIVNTSKDDKDETTVTSTTKKKQNGSNNRKKKDRHLKVGSIELER